MKIVLDNLTKEFSSKKETTIAVNNLSLEVNDGTLVGLLGPSGCGKSTVLNMICGLLEPTSGKIYFSDQDVTELSPQERKVGMVFQNYALYPHLTVKQNITFPLENLKGKDKLSKEKMDELALEYAKLVQIEDYLDRKPSELSGGQQQRVAIARALVKMPNVLLLDEPLSNLDARLRLSTREQIRNIQKKTGITTIFVTHDQEEAMSICDEIVVLQKGILMQKDEPQKVYDHPNNLFVAKFLGTPAINVFTGFIKENYLYIGDDKICSFKANNQEVYVGIRPEGFIVDETGPLKLKFERLQVMGRDTSIIAKSSSCITDEVRCIILSNSNLNITGNTINMSLKKDKFHVFNKDSEQIIHEEQ